MGYPVNVSYNATFSDLATACRTAVAALQRSSVPFALGGSFAAWAYGGPRPDNDLDLMVRRQDAEAALQVLVQAGMRADRPPENWLLKAWAGPVMIDLIFAPAGLEVDDEVLGRARTIDVLAVETPVLTLEDVLTTKLMALGEQSLDYRPLLSIVRSVREQIDWPALRARTAGSPYARAFFALTEELALVAPQGSPAAGGRPRVTVLTPGPTTAEHDVPAASGANDAPGAAGRA